MKKIIFVFALLLLAVPCCAQDLTHWYGSARISYPGGIDYHFGAEFTGNPNGGATIKLTSEFDTNAEFLGWNLRPVTVDVGVPLYAPYFDGKYRRARYGIKITANTYTIIIVPNDFAIQQALFYIAESRNTQATLSQKYPDNCAGAFALFSVQVPCEADGVIQVR